MRIAPANGKKALDIGSGYGRIVSHLIEKGYRVTAVEFNEDFVAELKRRFPSVKVMSEDVLQIPFEEKYDLITCIEVPNLNAREVSELLSKLAGAAPLLLVNMSNKHSFHYCWVKFRGWGNSFVFNHTPKEFEHIVEESGFEIVHRRGIGLVTPVSLFRDFKGKFIPQWLAKAVNKLDVYFPRICHLYYVEAASKKF